METDLHLQISHIKHV